MCVGHCHGQNDRTYLEAGYKCHTGKALLKYQRKRKIKIQAHVKLGISQASVVMKREENDIIGK